MSGHKKALAYAKAHGYSTADYLNKWNDYESFDLMHDDTGCIGLPQILLVSDTVVRMATLDEISDIPGWNDDSKYEDEE